MARKWYDSQVVRVEEIGPQTRHFWLQLSPPEPGEDPFQFRPGQFITMDLPIAEKRLQRWRSYSIASPPREDGVLELCIVKLDGGLASEYLFDTVQPGSIIRFKGPGGTFTLPPALEREIVMICTGTGVAPFRSMLLDLVQHPQKHSGIHLIFGTRYRSGILYAEEFTQMMDTMPGFRYSVALSRENLSGETAFPFPVQQGYVHPVYAGQYATVSPDRVFYLCGWQNMVDEAVEHLLAMGYDQQQIITELYG